jgi:hypothetical protein
MSQPAPDINPESPFGRFQQSRFGESRVQPAKGERFKCTYELCSMQLLSDEALQLHLIWHELHNLRLYIQESMKLLAGR